MDGIAAISARLGEIEGRIAAMRSAVPVAAPMAGTASSFAAALAQAQASRAGPFTQPATAVATPAAAAHLDANGAPLELAGFGNGRIPAAELSPIGGGHRLWEPAATAFTQLSAAARADGVQIGVTDSYRSFEAQVDVAARKGLYSQGGLAAVPGTSDHGWGRSLDLSLDPAAQQWMRANGPRFGFVEDVPGEPWHWTYGGSAPTASP